MNLPAGTNKETLNLEPWAQDTSDCLRQWFPTFSSRSPPWLRMRQAEPPHPKPSSWANALWKLNKSSSSFMKNINNTTFVFYVSICCRKKQNKVFSDLYDIFDKKKTVCCISLQVKGHTDIGNYLKWHIFNFLQASKISWCVECNLTITVTASLIPFTWVLTLGCSQTCIL